MIRIFVFAFLFCVPFNLLGQTDCQPTEVNADTLKPLKIEGKTYKITDEMPRFSGCERIEDEKERKKCSEKELLCFIYENIRWPSSHFCGEGTVIISFIVDKKGNVVNSNIVRDIGGGTGEEALKVVQLMPPWIPGKKDGKPVNVEINLPVKFQLEKAR